VRVFLFRTFVPEATRKHHSLFSNFKVQMHRKNIVICIRAFYYCDKISDNLLIKRQGCFGPQFWRFQLMSDPLLWACGGTVHCDRSIWVTGNEKEREKGVRVPITP
jgi:hypothetical protein